MYTCLSRINSLPRWLRKCVIVPTLRVGMLVRTLRIDVDAERQSLRYHAERGNDQQSLKYWLRSRGSEFIRDAVVQTIEVCRAYPPLANQFAPTVVMSMRDRSHAPRGDACLDAPRPH